MGATRNRKYNPYAFIAVSVVLFATTTNVVGSFSAGAPGAIRKTTIVRPDRTRLNESAASDVEEEILLKAFVEEEYPAFYNLLNLSKGIWKTIADSENGCTLFAPSDSVFDNLGDKKLKQLKDVRNEETAKKMGLYHVIPDEAVSAARLRTEDWTVKAPKGELRPSSVQAVVTMGGEVPVGRSKSGGLWGFGAKEDGDIVIGPCARIIKSYKVERSYVHEVDTLISPVLLWRYFDQLRIPGF